MGGEAHGQVVARVLDQAAGDLGVEVGHPGRGPLQPVAVGILAHGEEDLAHRLLDPGPVDRRRLGDEGLVHWLGRRLGGELLVVGGHGPTVGAAAPAVPHR